MDTLLDNAPCLYFALNTDGDLLQVNTTLCKALGYTKEELTGKKADTIFTLPTRIFCQTHLYPLLQMQGHAEEIFMSLQAKDKAFIPVLLNAQRDPLTNTSDCTGIIVHNRKKFEDELVAARKAAEDALLKNTYLQTAKEELQVHAEQLDEQVARLDRQHAELRQFNRAISHDLQEPLRKMLVFSNMLLETERGNLPAGIQSLVEKLLRVVNQMRTAVSGLQQYVWLNETTVNDSAVDLSKLLLVVQQDLEKEGSGDWLVVEAEPLPLVKADWEQMRLLFYSLLDNALKFRKEGEKAIVQITSTVLQQNRFRHLKDKYKYEDFLRIEVKDQGKGFDPAYNQKVFELFKRLHSGPGHGLGLSLSKKIVEGHGGMITANSTPEEGTTISILLPAHLVVDHADLINGK